MRVQRDPFDIYVPAGVDLANIWISRDDSPAAGYVDDIHLQAIERL